MEYVIGILAVAGFGYFVYTRYVAAKARRDAHVPGGGGGGGGDGGREQQVEK